MRGELAHGCIESLLADSRSYWVSPQVSELKSVPSALEFLRDFASESNPFIVRRACLSWRAIERWDLEYLSREHGELELSCSLTPDGHADSVRKGRFAQPAIETWTMRRLLASIAEREQDVVAYYSAQNSCLTDECDELRGDVDFDSVQFVRDALGTSESAVNLWIGDERSVTTCHADPFHNCYVVVHGVKNFELRPPCDASVLNRASWPDAKWERDEGKWKLVDDPNGGSTKWIQHGVKYQGEPVVVRVEPGDMLYIPPLWFHTVTQENLTIAVNWWFDMSYGMHWVMKQLFDNLGEANYGETTRNAKVIRNGSEEDSDSHDERGGTQDTVIGQVQ